MDKFLSFLRTSKSYLNTLGNIKYIHISMGNESCDLDSTVSSLLLGYFLSSQCPEDAVIPVLNVSYENFLLRTENCYVLREAGIPLDVLTFRDQLDFSNLIEKYTLKVSLVDHHVLNKNDDILQNYVTQIFDHRPVDCSNSWDSSKVNMRIEQIGSCCTLIADEILKQQPEILTEPLAYLLYQTIIYDTIALRPENGKAKPLDIDIGLKLENKFNFCQDRQTLFEKLWTAHNDVSHLTSKQLLYKDMKIIEGVYVPGLSMLVEEYLKISCAYEAITEFAVQHKVTCILLVGLNASSTVRRDLGIYSKTKDDKLKMALLNVFETNTDYDFQFEKRASAYNNIYLLHIHNIKLSRKQLVPLVKKAWVQYITTNN